MIWLYIISNKVPPAIKSPDFVTVYALRFISINFVQMNMTISYSYFEIILLL